MMTPDEAVAKIEATTARAEELRKEAEELWKAVPGGDGPGDSAPQDAAECLADVVESLNTAKALLVEAVLFLKGET